MKERTILISLTTLATLFPIFPLHAQQRGGPPPEAFTACENANEGDSCSFNAPHGTINGQCLTPPNLSALVCAPEGGPRGPGARLAERQGPLNGHPPPMGARRHTETQITHPLSTLAADTPPITDSEYNESTSGSRREIHANGISRHDTGPFPNAGNPNSISEQHYAYSVPLHPTIGAVTTPAWGYNFGIGVNGVPFDPGAAEWYLGRRHSKWQYTALSGVIPLGLDGNFAHVQPTGAYHYHGEPTGLLKKLGVNGHSHSPIIGWAADGFPIYALYGYEDSKDPGADIIALYSGYQIKAGSRPSGDGQPGGYYDGTFVADYEYVDGLSPLDECNGRFTVTPDYPDGTYAYFVTEDWPVIPRCFKGIPDPSFRKF